MAEGEDIATTVKASSPEMKDSSQDDVKLVIGNWIRDEDLHWHFDPKIVEGNQKIRLESGLAFKDLVVKVKDRLLLNSTDTTIKLFFQYPEWLSIDDGDGSTPQYITANDEVQAIIQMRRSIEEVDLCVTVTRYFNGWPTILHTSAVVGRPNVKGNGEGMDSDDDSRNSWYDFAMSDTPLTFPTQLQSGAPDANTDRSCRYAVRNTGITTREREEVIRLASPAYNLHGKGKGKVVTSASNVQSDTDSDSDEDIVVPTLTKRHSRIGKSSSKVRCRLTFSQVAGSESEASSDEDTNHNTQNDGDVPLTEGYNVWGRFQETLQNMLNDTSGDPVLFGRDAPPVFDHINGDGVDAALADVAYEGDQLFVGRVFKSKVDCKLKIAIHAIRQKFHFKTARSNPKFMVLKWVYRSCPWRVYAAMVDGSGNFQIREVAMEKSLGSMAGSFDLLPAYLGLLQAANPGTICSLENEEDPNGGMRFKYCFVAYRASIQGYKFMRKVIVVDGTSMKGKYGGCLVYACAQDANFQVFPLAFGIVDSENDAAWEWFFRQLSSFVSDSPELVFISDRHNNIYKGISEVYPSAHHAACTVHLWRNVRSRFCPKRLASMMGEAAREFTVNKFSRRFIDIQRLNPACAAYLVDIGFEHWTRAHFKGRRYNLMNSNIAESWNAVLKDAREFPLICMFEYIRTTVMNCFAIRRVKANKAEGTLTHNVRLIVEANFEASTGLAVRPISLYEFQVQEPNGECFARLTSLLLHVHAESFKS